MQNYATILKGSWLCAYHCIAGKDAAGLDAELCQLLLKFYPVNGMRRGSRPPALFTGMLDAARVKAVSLHLPDAMKRLYLKVGVWSWGAGLCKLGMQAGPGRFNTLGIFTQYL